MYTVTRSVRPQDGCFSQETVNVFVTPPPALWGNRSVLAPIEVPTPTELLDLPIEDHRQTTTRVGREAQTKPIDPVHLLRFRHSAVQDLLDFGLQKSFV
jgi:hypothetical protein